MHRDVDVREPVAALEVADREKARTHELASQKSSYLLYGFVALLICALCAYALHLDKVQFATELLKVLLPLVAGGVGGYGLAAAKYKNKNDKAD